MRIWCFDVIFFHIAFQETIIETGLMKPEGLAADWVNNKLYWTDCQTKRIEVASADPPKDTKGVNPTRRVLVWEDLDMPRAIAVAPNDGLMFWTDWGEFPKIERASMDGDPDSRTILVDREIAWPNGKPKFPTQNTNSNSI